MSEEPEVFLPGEIIPCITRAVINDIHAYLESAFDIVAEERTWDDGSVIFNVEDVPREDMEKVVHEISEIVGIGFTVFNEEIQKTIIVKKV
jgi:ribose 5-phosphate isomerase